MCHGNYQSTEDVAPLPVTYYGPQKKRLLVVVNKLSDLFDKMFRLRIKRMVHGLFK